MHACVDIAAIIMTTLQVICVKAAKVKDIQYSGKVWRGKSLVNLVNPL